MGNPRLLAAVLPLALLVWSSPASAIDRCLAAAATVEKASAGRDVYGFGSPRHAVDARGVLWKGIAGHALELVGDEKACFAGGRVEGPYLEDAVFECQPQHCPGGKCPIPCKAYHVTAALSPAVSAPQTVIEDFRASGYGDGISLNQSSGDLLIRRAYFRDFHDDAIESDWGTQSVIVFDSLFDRVTAGLATRQRKNAIRSSTQETWAMHYSLMRLHAWSNTYKMRKGHGGFFKADRRASAGVRYRLTNNVFLAGPVAGSGVLLFPIVTQTDQCANNRLLWSGSRSAWDRALDDGDGYPDGLTNRQRLAALSHCYSVTLKPSSDTESKFVAERWAPLVAKWRASHLAGAP